MSADNYTRVNRHPDGGYFLDTVFASDEDWQSPEETLEFRRRNWSHEAYENMEIYPTLGEATAAAHEDYSEYGVIYSFETKVVDTSG